MSAVPEQQTVSTSKYKVEDVIAKYLNLRDEKEKLAAQFKATTEGLDAQMSAIERWIHALMQQVGTDQFKAQGIGTAFKMVTDFCSVADWNATLEFVKEHNAYHILTKGVSKTAVKEFIDQSGGVPPPGVNYGTKEEVQIRRGK